MPKVQCIVTSSYANRRDAIEIKPKPSRPAAAKHSSNIRSTQSNSKRSAAVGRTHRSSLRKASFAENENENENEKEKATESDDGSGQTVNAVLYRRFLARQEVKKAKKKTELFTVSWLQHRWLEKHGKANDWVLHNQRLRILRDWFNLLDADGSGELGVDELSEPLVSTGLAHSKEEVEQLLQVVNKTPNGEISFDEFLSMMNESSSITLASSSSGGKASNPVVTLYNELMSGNLGDVQLLELPSMLSVYRRKMIIAAYLAQDAQTRDEGRSILRALERLRAESAAAEQQYRNSTRPASSSSSSEDTRKSTTGTTPMTVRVDEKYRKKYRTKTQGPHGVNDDDDGDGDTTRVRQYYTNLVQHKAYRERCLLLPCIAELSLQR